MTPKEWAQEFKDLIAKAQADGKVVYGLEQTYEELDDLTEEYGEVHTGEVYLYVGYADGDGPDALIGDITL